MSTTTAGPRVRRDCTHPVARHQHGTRAAYLRDRCRCFSCSVAASHAARVYRAGGSWPEQEWATHVGVSRRLQALMTLGWSARDLAERTGLTEWYVQNLRNDVKHPKVRRETWQTIAAVYDALWDKPSPSAQASRTRGRARHFGYLPPLAWDDETIDDPHAQPATADIDVGLDEVLIDRFMAGAHRRARGSHYPPELVEAARRLAAHGMTVTGIGQRLGMDKAAASKLCTRNGIRTGQRAA